MYQFELARAANVLVRELFALSRDETLVVSSDTGGNREVVNSVAAAAFSLGAKPIVVWYPTPPGVAKQADPVLPDSFVAALSKADAWFSVPKNYVLYSDAYYRVFELNPNLRYKSMGGLDEELMIRTFCGVNYPALREFQNRLHGITAQARAGKVTSKSGTNVVFENDPNRTVTNDTGYADTPGTHFSGGQIAWSPRIDSINGDIVFDGSIFPPNLFPLYTPVTLHVEHGQVVTVDGGYEAKEFESWLRSFDHPQMLKIAHAAFGFLPTATLSGNIGQAERVWGCTEWGIGEIGGIFGKPVPAPSHTDGICLKSSVWFDGTQITEEGRVVHEELKGLADAAQSEA